MEKVNSSWNKPGQNLAEKNSIPYASRVLVIEDDRGMKTSFFPGLAWNGMGYSYPPEQEFSHAEDGKKYWSYCPDPDPLGKRTQMADLKFVDIDRTRKIYSAKSILRDISSHYESSNRNLSLASEKPALESQAYLHSNLLYLIAATDGYEDSVGHSKTVARYTLFLAKAMGIEDRSFLAEIARGALLHDIGKIGIPESILRKPGSLTDREKEIIKEHPLLGYEIIEEFPFLQKASHVVLFHHEFYGGQGYPYGLKGENIPLEARIFAIADTLDAITSDRPYRRGQSFRVAREEIERHSGTQFDPSIVDAFLAIPEENWQQIKAEMDQSPILYSIH
jgi:putative nucleotidyltransferase with HDIG domain